MGVLFEKFGFRVMMLIVLNLEAKLFSIIHNGN